MKTKEIIINALKHFIRYNKNREEIFIRYYGRKQKVSGLCEYLKLYSQMNLGLDSDYNYETEEFIREYRKEIDEYLKVSYFFRSLVRQYIGSTGYISTENKVTKKRLSVAQKIINKLEKQLQSS